MHIPDLEIFLFTGRPKRKQMSGIPSELPFSGCLGGKQYESSGGAISGGKFEFRHTRSLTFARNRAQTLQKKIKTGMRSIWFRMLAYIVAIKY